ncbi:MAG: helix-turn-helix transcriptional regulator [Clostridiales bacterium]|nr:helix-turn-helix transcriptional regulator [Clostridiales bacterium]
MYSGYIKRIRDLREDHDKTQQEIADILGTSQTMYARYERGANELPIHHLITLCKYYNVSADYILGFTSKSKNAYIQPNQKK